ncbi:MAG: glycosyltransferase family 39 protein [Nitrospirae bacterium]|nr:glycosyltransferase family 39 protein [Nitrospirota bacterium]
MAMYPGDEGGTYRRPVFLFHKPASRLIILGILFVTAFAIRMHNISRPPLDFQPIRQYQLAHIARSGYFEGAENIPQWKKDIAKINNERIGFLLEPRIMERAAVLGYKIAGGERLWIPRVMSSIFWMIGGIFVYLIACKIFTPDEALVSAVFYLFLPFGISASRSFQPDPFMVMLLLVSLFMILKYHEQLSFLMLISAIIPSSLAMLIKPYSIFLIFGAFISIAINKQGIRKSLTDRDFLMFIFLSPLPGALYYLSSMFAQDSFVMEHAQASFLPHLLYQGYFWKDWLAMIARAVGLTAFAGALSGLFLVRGRLPGVLLKGLWTGYFIFGLLFTFQILQFYQ